MYFDLTQMNEAFSITLARKFFFACLALALLFPFFTQAQGNKKTSVLFVGNSYTYFWNMPQVLQAMGESQGVSIIARQSTASGISLHRHWDDDRKLKTRERITESKWDYVVLQNHSKSTIDSLTAFKEYGNKFISLIKVSGAKPLLYMTWAREHNPTMQAAITKGYLDLGKETDSKVVPVGLIWKKALESKPELKLFMGDGSHPSPIGTYLIALCFYKAITGLPTADIPGTLTTVDKEGEKLYLSIVPSKDADFLQNLVDTFEK